MTDSEQKTSAEESSDDEVSPAQSASISSSSSNSSSGSPSVPSSSPVPGSHKPTEPDDGRGGITRRNGTGFRMHSRDVSHDDVPDVVSSPRRKSSDFSKPIVERTVVLRSSQAQKEFEHCWVRTDYSLYIATKAARAQWRLDDARRAEKIFEGMFNAFRDELCMTVKSVNALIEQKVDEANRGIVFDHVRTQKVPVRTGFSTRLIDISEMLDSLIAGVELLEISNAISAEEADKTVRSWTARYRHFCAAINRARVESLRVKA